MNPPLQVLIAEKSNSLAGLLTRFLEEANFSVAVATTVEEAVALVESRKPEVVLSSVSRFDGEQLCKKLRKLDRALPVALIYPPNHAEKAEPRARMLGADLVLIGPVQQAALVSATRLLIRMRRQAREMAEAAAGPALEREPEEAPPDLATLKRILAMEVKKSRRYKYPASFLLVSIDGFAEKARPLDREGRARLVGSALVEFTRALRDIDLCVHAGNDRFIVFLPHTPHAGARIVAGRLHARVRSLGITASVGVASYDGQGQVSFGSLLKDATLALKRAKQAGGDRVELTEAKRPDRVFIA